MAVSSLAVQNSEKLTNLTDLHTYTTAVEVRGLMSALSAVGLCIDLATESQRVEAIGIAVVAFFAVQCIYSGLES